MAQNWLKTAEDFKKYNRYITYLIVQTQIYVVKTRVVELIQRIKMISTNTFFFQLLNEYVCKLQ